MRYALQRRLALKSLENNMSKKLVLLSIGSNIERDKNIALAKKYLSEIFPDIIFSSTYITEDTSHHKQEFYNLAAKFTTEENLETLIKQSHQLEALLGRVRNPNDKNIPRTIDIDVCYYDNTTLDKNLPYFKYLIDPLSEIAPDFIDSETGLLFKQLQKQCQDTHAIQRK